VHSFEIKQRNSNPGCLRSWLLYKSKRATENKEQSIFANTLEALDVTARQWRFEASPRSDPDTIVSFLGGPNETRAS
jgi:hypothetical protein